MTGDKEVQILRMTLDELINAMEPQARKDKALISKCVDGLTEYAAELRQKAGDAGKEQISALRRLVDELAGYSQIADEMTQQGVRYHQHTAQWNKHMVKRILENERYLGMDGYPQLVTDEEFLAARLRRGEQNTYAPCPSEIIPIRDKAVCALCGEKMARDTKSRGRPRWRCKNPECGGSVYLDDSIILERVVQKLKVLAHSPECIRLPKAAPASTDALRIENELALCFNRADINPEYMKTLIMAAAAERYAGLNDPTPAHKLELLRQKLELEPESEETLWEVFESAVAQVRIGKGGEISLHQKDQKECAL